MPATMDKKDVLYRVAYKNINSIKWGTITKLAKKEVPQTVKDEVRRFLDDEKNNKMEAKLGMVRKGKKAELVLRIKNGSKHLYDSVIQKDFTPPTESEKGDFDNQQGAKLKLALKEVEVVHKQTETFVAVLKSLSGELDRERKAHETLAGKFDPNKITKPEWMTFSLACADRKRNVNKIADRANEALEAHKKEISAFRGGGAAKIGTKHGLDEDRKALVSKKFADHTKFFAQAEQKTKSLELKVHQLSNEIGATIKLYDADTDKTAAMKEFLTASLQTWAGGHDAQSRNHFQKNDMEKYLTYTAKKYPVVTVDAGIDFIENKLENAETAFAKLNKRINDTLKKVPKSQLANGEITELIKKIGNFKITYGADLRDFTERCTKARTHLKKVLAELNA